MRFDRPITRAGPTEANRSGRWCATPFCGFFGRARWTIPLDRSVYADFLRSGAAVAIAAPRILERTRPDVIVQLNGRFFERILNRFVPPEIPIVIYEAGWRRDTLGFDRLGPRGLVDLNRAWEASRGVPLAADQSAELDRWMSERTSGDMQRDFYIAFDTKSTDPFRALGLNPPGPRRSSSPISSGTLRCWGVMMRSHQFRTGFARRCRCLAGGRTGSWSCGYIRLRISDRRRNRARSSRRPSAARVNFRRTCASSPHMRP